jgi:hypothetical protein
LGWLYEPEMNWETVVNSADSVLRAMEIEQKYQLSFWDGMIVQAAKSAGCEVRKICPMDRSTAAGWSIRSCGKFRKRNSGQDAWQLQEACKDG